MKRLEDYIGMHPDIRFIKYIRCVCYSAKYSASSGQSRARLIIDNSLELNQKKNDRN